MRQPWLLPIASVAVSGGQLLLLADLVALVAVRVQVAVLVEESVVTGEAVFADAVISDELAVLLALFQLDTRVGGDVAAGVSAGVGAVDFVRAVVSPRKAEHMSCGSVS